MAVVTPARIVGALGTLTLLSVAAVQIWLRLPRPLPVAPPSPPPTVVAKPAPRTTPQPLAESVRQAGEEEARTLAGPLWYPGARLSSMSRRDPKRGRDDLWPTVTLVPPTDSLETLRAHYDRLAPGGRFEQKTYRIDGMRRTDGAAVRILVFRAVAGPEQGKAVVMLMVVGG